MLSFVGLFNLRHHSHVFTSGAIQYGGPMKVFLLPMVRSSWALTPKSTSLTSALSVSSTFWPLMSRWMTLHACKWVKPRSTSLEQATRSQKRSRRNRCFQETLIPITKVLALCFFSNFMCLLRLDCPIRHSLVLVDTSRITDRKYTSLIKDTSME